MPKQKTKKNEHRSELDNLREQVRNLKSIVRHLKRELLKSRKSSNKKIDPQEFDEVELEEEFIKNSKCKECGKGFIKSTPIGARTLITCTICSYRRTEK